MFIQKVFKILTLISVPFFLFSCNSDLNKKQAKMVAYLYKEGFETSNPLNYFTSSNNLPKPKIRYSFDNKNFTEGNSSLSIDINISGYNNQEAYWYYYLQIPIKDKPNLEGKLSFSMDINMDEETSEHLQIGLSLLFSSIGSGIYKFDEISTVNKWTTIKSSNLNLLTFDHDKKWINDNLYNATLDDIGRSVYSIVLLFKGKGAKHFKFHIDNIEISGTQIDKKEFIIDQKSSWDRYITNIENMIKERKEEKEKLSSLLFEIKKETLSSMQLKIYKKSQEYLKKINLLLSKLDINNKKSFYLMDDLDKTISQYKHMLNRLKKREAISIYKFPSLEYYRLNGYNTPLLEEANSYRVRMTAGEYKPISLLLEVNKDADIYTAQATDFKGDNGSFSKENLDLYIAKIWYQAGLNSTFKTGKFLTQELLLKDESLIKVDFDKNSSYLKIIQNNNNKIHYINISDKNSTFPDLDTITFNDSKNLKPFKLDTIRHKLLWANIHIPKDILPGIYRTTIEIKNLSEKIKKNIPIEVEVLPFTLDQSKLTYSLYYHGQLNEHAKSVSAFYKRYKQLELELLDMKEHGVLYPTSYDSIVNLDKVLEIRGKIGLPKDKFYSLGLRTYKPKVLEKIEKYKKKLNKYHYDKDALYIYAIDEGNRETLKSQIDTLQKIKDSGTKIFVAGDSKVYRYLGDLLDMFVLGGGVLSDYAKVNVKKWHKSKHKIFAYASPQVGVENPEIYRRNFGCKLWKKGFDGAMDYAYQKQYGAFWNDFDSDTKYREETFTYPTTDGLIDTVQWEGYRAAITDVRYISTLENLRDKLMRTGYDVSQLNSWINNINCDSDLDELRENIIDKILEYEMIIHE